ncbi:MAG TPA: peptidoglycan DD-metalloendopeptidase family protein [Usitatibacteraceae bacterium]|nr:peptidoglycan DD-metalloendopeptidase family protein [Usitatibacteraceae bacterium]
MNLNLVLRILLVIAAALAAACTSPRPAPVSDVGTIPAKPGVAAPSTAKPATPAVAGEARPAAGDKVHVIQKGDTMISIALANGLDYRELAAWNNIENPNVIKLGETLRLTPPGALPAAPGSEPKPGEPVATPLVITPMPTPSAGPGNTDKFKTEPKAGKVPYSDAAYAKAAAEAGGAPVSAAVPPAATGTATAAAPAAPAASSSDVDWAWPIQPAPKGKLLATFTDANKGIDIPGAKGAPVLAAGPGKVVYSGSGLRGYGRLVIIKHNDTWLSAYAHNEKILVMEGDVVTKGQKIAEMGSSDADQVKLHFEIRKQGKPVDPLRLLPN